MWSRNAAFIAALCCATLPAFRSGAQTVIGKEELKFAEDYRKAVALLEGQNMSGGFEMACTATPFERKGKIVRFISAAHCVAEDDADHGRVVLRKGLTWYLTLDEGGTKKVLYRAKLVAVGYQSRQDDFVVSEAEIEETVPLIPFAKKPARVLEPVVNVASPHGFGKQVFTGHVSSDKLDRPAQEGSINWKDAILTADGRRRRVVRIHGRQPRAEGHHRLPGRPHGRQRVDEHRRHSRGAFPAVLGALEGPQVPLVQAGRRG